MKAKPLTSADSLDAKDFQYLIEYLNKIPSILSRPDIVIHDYQSPQDTLIYYKRLRIVSLGIHQEPSRRRTGKGVLSQGYGDSSIPDLLVDYRLDANRPFAWISYNFDKTNPAIIWIIKLLMADDLFDLPQAGLEAVPLHEAFGWAYAHFILEDEVPALPLEKLPKSSSLAGQVLRYAAAAI